MLIISHLLVFGLVIICVHLPSDKLFIKSQEFLDFKTRVFVLLFIVSLSSDEYFCAVNELLPSYLKYVHNFITFQISNHANF